MGCIPTKALVRAAEIAHLAHRGEEFGVDCTVRVDGERVMQRVAGIIERGRAYYEDAIAADEGLRLVRGRGWLRADGVVEVPDGTGTAEVAGVPVIVAAGSRPAAPRIDGIDGTPAMTSDDLLRLDRLPRSVVVVGAGAIGCEATQALARLGVEVTWLLRGEHPLTAEEPESGLLVARVARTAGARVVTGVRDLHVAPDEEGVVARWNGGSACARAERLLTATGREPAVDGAIAPGALVLDLGGIRVDETLATSRPGVWAIGDGVGGAHRHFMYTHVATHEGPLAAQNALLGTRHVVRYDRIPRVVFTDPEVASVGLTELVARAAGHDVATHVKLVREVGKARALGETEGFVKLVLDRPTRRLLGATVVAAHAGDMLAELTMPLQRDGDLSDLLATIHPHPTLSEAIKVAVREATADPGDGRPYG